MEPKLLEDNPIFNIKLKKPNNISKGNILYKIHVIISKKDGMPIIELRRRSNNSEMISALVYAAVYDKPVIILPYFKNKWTSIGTLMKLGILYYDAEKETYEWNI